MGPSSATPLPRAPRPPTPLSALASYPREPSPPLPRLPPRVLRELAVVTCGTSWRQGSTLRSCGLRASTGEWSNRPAPPPAGEAEAALAGATRPGEEGQRGSVPEAEKAPMISCPCGARATAQLVLAWPTSVSRALRLTRRLHTRPPRGQERECPEAAALPLPPPPLPPHFALPLLPPLQRLRRSAAEVGAEVRPRTGTAFATNAMPACPPSPRLPSAAATGGSAPARQRALACSARRHVSVSSRQLPLRRGSGPSKRLTVRAQRLRQPRSPIQPRPLRPLRPPHPVLVSPSLLAQSLPMPSRH